MNNAPTHAIAGLGGFAVGEGVADALTRKTGRPMMVNVGHAILGVYGAVKTTGPTSTAALGLAINAGARMLRHALPWLDLGQTETTIAAARRDAEQIMNSPARAVAIDRGARIPSMRFPWMSS